MDIFDRFTLQYKQDGIPTIENCQCRAVHTDTETGKTLKCSEIICGMSFEKAKSELIKDLERHIERIKECKTYKEYEFTVR